MELEARFKSEEGCRAYLEGLRWPDGFDCPYCPGRKGWSDRRGRWTCARCGRQCRATTGTVFQDSHLPLTLWFRAAWWVTSQKTGASALGLQRVLGLGSYRTAWACLHKLRGAMVRPGRDRLHGEVEVDETFVGGVEPGGGRRHMGKKALVAIAAEGHGRTCGRIRLRRIRDATAGSLLPFVRDSIEPGSLIVTDGFATYLALPSLGYRHEARPIRGDHKEIPALLPRVHRVASLLKRWLLGTHQGAVSREHLDGYLDEFTFRFNRRTSMYRGKLFHRLMEQAVIVGPRPYAAIAKGVRGRRRKPDHKG